MRGARGGEGAEEGEGGEVGLVVAGEIAMPAVSSELKSTQ